MVNGQCIIFVNGFNIYARQRFTVAHELGHYVNDILTYDAEKFIDTATTLYRNDITDPKIDPRDIRANQFAAKLLMPKKDILTESQALLAKRDELALTGELFIEKMAQIFQVSKPAMIIRLRKIGLLK